MSKKICIFGDSITQGYYDLERGGWVNRLGIFLTKIDTDFSIFNLGISGDTSFDLLERIENEIRAREPETIIINIGVNDAVIEKGNSWTELKIFKENLEKLLKISQKFTKEIFFTGILNVDEKFSTPASWDKNLYCYNEEIKKYDLAIEKFCREKNIIFVPLWGLLKEKEISDGIHPNAEGHEKIFKKVKSVLKENRIV